MWVHPRGTVDLDLRYFSLRTGSMERRESDQSSQEALWQKGQLWKAARGQAQRQHARPQVRAAGNRSRVVLSCSMCYQLTKMIGPWKTIPGVSDVTLPTLWIRETEVHENKGSCTSSLPFWQSADLELNLSLFDTKAQAFDHSAEVLTKMDYTCWWIDYIQWM